MAYHEIALPSRYRGLGDDTPALVSPFGPQPLVKIDGIPLPVSGPQMDPATFSRFEIPWGHRGTTETLEKMAQQVILNSQDPYFVMDARGVVRGIPSKDYEAEADALMQWAHGAIDYRHDPALMEWCSSPGWLLYIDGQGDCFPRGTLVFTKENRRLVPIESLRAGDEIWGLDRWSKVQWIADRGVRKTWAIRLNNGGVQRLTPEHHVWKAVCQKHGKKPCCCSVNSRRLERIPVSELRPKDAVVQPGQIPFGSLSDDPGRAYVEGLYVSEGWSDRPSAFFISGRDGFPREEQKREVECICARLRIPTRWHARYIAVKDKVWTAKLAECGGLAWTKRLRSLDLVEATAREMLRGVMADSCLSSSGTGRVFSTSSPELFLQTRVLLKMFGVSCGAGTIAGPRYNRERDSHRLTIRSTLGQIGTIYRKEWDVKARARPSTSPAKVLRVLEVIRDDLELPCVDLETDDHMVWLPESDWTTSQCNNGTSLVAALDIAIGHGAAFRAVAIDPTMIDPDTGGYQYSHVYTRVGLRRGPEVVWLAQDLVPSPPVLGAEPPASLWLREPNDFVIVQP